MRILGDFSYPCMGESVPVKLEVLHYDNGRIALQLVSEMEEAPGNYEPFTTLTVNMVDQECELDEAWIKNWSENEGAVEWMQLNELIEEGPLDNAQTGHAFVEKFRFTKKLMDAIAEQLVAEGIRSRR